MGFFFKLLLKAGLTLGVMVVGYKFILPAMLGGGGFQLPGAIDDASNGISKLGNAVIQKDVTVYQWVDDKGVTHFDGMPPTGQGAYEQKTIRANTNLLQAQKSSREEEKEQTQNSRVAKIGNIYSPGGIKSTIDSAKDLKDKASERSADQEKILNEIMGNMK